MVCNTAAACKDSLVVVVISCSEDVHKHDLTLAVADLRVQHVLSSGLLVSQAWARLRSQGIPQQTLSGLPPAAANR